MNGGKLGETWTCQRSAARLVSCLRDIHWYTYERSRCPNDEPRDTYIVRSDAGSSWVERRGSLSGAVVGWKADAVSVYAGRFLRRRRKEAPRGDLDPEQRRVVSACERRRRGNTHCAGHGMCTRTVSRSRLGWMLERRRLDVTLAAPIGDGI